MEWTPEDLDNLSQSVDLLESPGLAARVTSLLGAPIEKAMNLLPAPATKLVHEATQGAITKAMSVAARTLANRPGRPSADRFHLAGASLAGGVGGFFGLAGLAMELPVTTVIMLRSIADIAREQGEDLSDLEARMACVQVFALGGRPGVNEGTETGYYAVRAALARSVSDAVRYLAQGGAVSKGTPVLVRFISQVAARYGVVVSEKLAAQAVPVLGSLGGAAVNAVFTDLFQKTARGHFTVRRLEGKFGPGEVRKQYEDLLAGRG
ncbi:MAG: EcsC family protein [Proteobacteria bacterium]|nr:EcsC family protein [Pseudomonadota bacterium]